MSAREPARAGRYFLLDAPYADALAAWEAQLAAAEAPERTPIVELPLEEALGRVLARPVWARTSSPPFDAAAMDGVAVRSETTIGALDTVPLRLAQGQFLVVDTGDPMPEGFDAVVMREDVELTPEAATIRAPVAPYQHVRSIGEDVSATELLLPLGVRLRPPDLAAIAAAGHATAPVHRAPVVAVLPTGDELVPVGSEPGAGEIVDTNSLMLGAQVRAAGYTAIVLPICRDDPALIAEALLAAAREADLVLVGAGSSAGRDDYTARVVDSVGSVSVHGVAVKPGHPVVLGVVESTPVIGVPGYPVSAAMTFDLFAAPLLARLEGTLVAARPRAVVKLARKLASSMGSDDWIRVRVGRVRGTLVGAPLSRGAGVLTSLVRADALLLIPAGVEGRHAGDDVEVELLRSTEEIEQTIVVVGSHDPVLDLAASHLHERSPGARLASSNVGSLGGLVAIRDGLCHVAGSHLLDPASGVYTLPILDRIVPDRPIAVIRLVHRMQGLLVAPGNPLGIAGLDDLPRPGLRYVNRQRGAGTRVLLDHELDRRGISPDSIAGYAREEPTHLGVAATIAAGRADCGLGVQAAARALGLGFVPVTEEPYDLVLDAATLDDPIVAPFLDLLEDAAFREAIVAMGGYSTRETGRRIR
jgi:putative molybdopterin biosynthesis protein